MPDFFILKHLRLSACAQSGSRLLHKRFNDRRSQAEHSSYDLNSQFCCITSKLLYKRHGKKFNVRSCRKIQLTLRRSKILNTDQAPLLAKLIIMTTQFNPTLTIQQPRALVTTSFRFWYFLFFAVVGNCPRLDTCIQLG